jgi:Sugar phosphate permease
MVLFILCLLTLSVQDKEAQGDTHNDFWETFMSVVLNYRIFIYALLTIGICATVTTLSDLWGNAFLITKYRLSETQAVLYNQFMFAGSLLGSFIVPLIFSGGRKVLLGVRVCCWSVVALFAVLIYATNQISGVVLQTALFFLGFFAYGDVLCFALAAQLSTPKTSGLIVGWVNTINMIGLTLLQMFVGHSLDEYWNGAVNAQGLRLYQASDYELALGLLLNVALICGFISFFIRTKKVRE